MVLRSKPALYAPRCVQINSRSKALALTGDPHSRLYDAAVERLASKAAAQVAYIDSHVQHIPAGAVKGVLVSTASLTAGSAPSPRAGTSSGGAGAGRSHASGRAGGAFLSSSPSMSPAVAPPIDSLNDAAVNIVPWNRKYAFVYGHLLGAK